MFLWVTYSCGQSVIGESNAALEKIKGRAIGALRIRMETGGEMTLKDVAPCRGDRRVVLIYAIGDCSPCYDGLMDFWTEAAAHLDPIVLTANPEGLSRSELQAFKRQYPGLKSIDTVLWDDIPEEMRGVLSGGNTRGVVVVLDSNARVVDSWADGRAMDGGGAREGRLEDLKLKGNLPGGGT